MNLPFNLLFDCDPVVGRKAGRPKGTTGWLLQNARALGLNRFAFLRATLLRLTLAEAFARCPTWPEAARGKL